MAKKTTKKMSVEQVIGKSLPGFKKVAVKRKFRAAPDAKAALASNSLQQMQMKYTRGVSDAANAVRARAVAGAAKLRTHAKTVTYAPEGVSSDTAAAQSRTFVVKGDKVVAERG
jgi:hypothetical protein